MAFISGCVNGVAKRAAVKLIPIVPGNLELSITKTPSERLLFDKLRLNLCFDCRKLVEAGYFRMPVLIQQVYECNYWEGHI